MNVRPENTYSHQFQIWFEELIEQHARFRLAVIDGQTNIEKEAEDLKLARKTLEDSGVQSPMRFSMMEKSIESLSLRRTGLKMEESLIRGKIELLLEKILAWFGEIQDDHDRNKINRMQFVSYLKRYKHLLHEGNSLKLPCYSGPTVNKVNDCIENYKII